MYFATGDTIMAVDIASGDRPAGTPHALFTEAGLSHGYGRSHAVTPDGQRFLAIVAETGQPPHPATVVLTWHSALRAREKR